MKGSDSTSIWSKVMAVVLFMAMVALAIMSFVFYSKARKMEREQEKQLEGYGSGTAFQAANRQLTSDVTRDLMHLRPQDIITYVGTDYIVEGRLDYAADGYAWVSYLLVDGDQRVWLSVEEDDQLEVQFWDEIPDLKLPENPPDIIDYQGQRFQLVEWGEADVNRQGLTGRRQQMHTRYYEYESEDEEYMSVEVWGHEVEASLGRDVNPDLLEILPGDVVRETSMA